MKLDPNAPIDLLGGMTTQTFLREYWQKKPLLIRNACVDVGERMNFEQLSKLATQEDVESRLILANKTQHETKWTLKKGPFSPTQLSKLPPENWTILVQGVNLYRQQVSDLLWKFNFLPFARLDDLMISYAPKGGTVGAHFDSYDVFLLQVDGKKRWQISSNKNYQLDSNAPLKILKDFEAEASWELEHGDMLYLPPQYAHYGVSIEAGMTYSIGFRAPSKEEFAVNFLEYLLQRGIFKHESSELYTDPDLTFQEHPAEISGEMIKKVTDIVNNIQWSAHDVADFLGHYLSEPKPSIYFDAVDDPVDEAEFQTIIEQKGLCLDLKSLLLFQNNQFYLNGNKECVPDCDVELWKTLANTRQVHGKFSTKSIEILYNAYLFGLITIQKNN